MTPQQHLLTALELEVEKCHNTQASLTSQIAILEVRREEAQKHGFALRDLRDKFRKAIGAEAQPRPSDKY